MAFTTGLAEALGKGITSWIPAPSTVALTLTFTAVAIVLSEATSNTAAANMIVPISIAVAIAAGVRPIEPALGATLGASMGFMMPVSTPPNAIVYSSGYVPITAMMMRYGLALDLVGFGDLGARARARPADLLGASAGTSSKVRTGVQLATEPKRHRAGRS